MEDKTLLQVYGCKDCPVASVCGTMINSTRLCHGYIQPKLQKL